MLQRGTAGVRQGRYGEAELHGVAHWTAPATRSPAGCGTTSYLHSAAAHGTAALDAVRAAIAGKPWLPPLPAVS
jgi:hypothetical protein